jgi:light-regulated signal transduction histidine kinase (bacteriophytochrome)
VIRSDITDSYEQEQQRLARMREALAAADQANEAKSVFLSTMSHDLRTPLNGVLGFTGLALQADSPEKKQEYLQKIQYSGRLLLNLINDTLELSRIESGKVSLTPEVVSSREVGQTVLDSLRPTAEAKGVKLLWKTPPDQYLRIDKLKYQKIWINLLSNAIKYTPAGGTVRAAVEILDPPVGGRNRRIVVEDTGIGMSEAFLSRMFEPFSQENRPEAGNAGGTGLGLAIVKRIVDLLGARSPFPAPRQGNALRRRRAYRGRGRNPGRADGPLRPLRQLRRAAGAAVRGQPSQPGDRRHASQKPRHGGGLRGKRRGGGAPVLRLGAGDLRRHPHGHPHARDGRLPGRPGHPRSGPARQRRAHHRHDRRRL